MGEAPGQKQRFLMVDWHVGSATGIRAWIQVEFPELIGDTAYSLSDALTLLYHNRYDLVVIDPYGLGEDPVLGVIAINTGEKGCPRPEHMLIVSTGDYQDALHWIPRDNHFRKPPELESFAERIAALGFRRCSTPA